MAKKPKIKKGDRVAVLTGRDKGKTGEVLRVYPNKDRVLVRGVNVAKRHQSPRPGSPGGIIEKEMPLHVSNVAHVDPKTSRATRVGWRIESGGRKVRYAKRSGEAIDL